MTRTNRRPWNVSLDLFLYAKCLSTFLSAHSRAESLLPSSPGDGTGVRQAQPTSTFALVSALLAVALTFLSEVNAISSVHLFQTSSSKLQLLQKRETLICMISKLIEMCTLCLTSISILLAGQYSNNHSISFDF